MLTRLLLFIPRLFVGAQRFTMPRGFRRDWVLSEEDFASTVRVGGHKPVQGLIEQLRSLYLALVEKVGETGSIAVCSPCKREGRSTAIVNLAITMAHDTGRNVTILDLDLADPDQAELLEIPLAPGFTDFRSGDRVTDYLALTSHPGLTLLHAGAPTPDAVKDLQSGRLEEVLEQLREMGHFVIVDTPAALGNVDARIIAERVSGVATLVKLGKTKRSDLAPYYRAYRDLPLLGAICNYHEAWIPRWLQRFL